MYQIVYFMNILKIIASGFLFEVDSKVGYICCAKYYLIRDA